MSPPPIKKNLRKWWTFFQLRQNRSVRRHASLIVFDNKSVSSEGFANFVKKNWQNSVISAIIYKYRIARRYLSHGYKKNCIEMTVNSVSEINKCIKFFQESVEYTKTITMKKCIELELNLKTATALPEIIKLWKC